MPLNPVEVIKQIKMNLKTLQVMLFKIYINLANKIKISKIQIVMYKGCIKHLNAYYSKKLLKPQDMIKTLY